MVQATQNFAQQNRILRSENRILAARVRHLQRCLLDGSRQVSARIRDARADYFAKYAELHSLQYRYWELAREHASVLDTLQEVDGFSQVEHDRRRRVMWLINTQPDVSLEEQNRRLDIRLAFHRRGKLTLPPPAP